jgi:hypothetical protein
MRAKLTQGFIDDYPPPSNDSVLIWDEDYPGFGAVILASGKRHFVVQYRLGGKVRRRHLNGGSLSNARRQAKALLGKVETNRLLQQPTDPLPSKRERALAERREKARVETADKRLFKAVARDFMIKKGFKLRTADQIEQTINQHLNPAIGAISIDEA